MSPPPNQSNNNARPPFSSSSDEQHFLIDDAHPVHIHWDLKNAKLSDDPEPLSDYYVALISNHQVVLLDGDQKLEAFRRTGSGPSVFDPVLVSKKEHVFGKKRFITRAKLDVRSKKTHEICVEYCCSSSTGSLDCEMGIKIDGGEMMRVKRLQWKFRGHESVTVSSKVKVEVYWDVHDWLFSSCNNGLRHALFIFKPVAAETEPSAAVTTARIRQSSACFCTLGKSSRGWGHLREVGGPRFK
ncbi:uncharacterized protein A4U43_C04F20040 [Asparagus officinalis]|uniref:DUF868 domain-containing protein n=1 Tax=Asparagus officinalis TaxID=4686 RepID=A0A5P1F504_ASPOF|nr:uncharacterized protein A4U43_C04F20040 [Asparagus officinalis]